MDDVSIIQTLGLPLQPCHSASLPLKHPFRVCYQRSKLILILRASLVVLLELVRFAPPVISAPSRRIRYRKPKKVALLGSTSVHPGLLRNAPMWARHWGQTTEARAAGESGHGLQSHRWRKLWTVEETRAPRDKEASWAIRDEKAKKKKEENKKKRKRYYGYSSFFFYHEELFLLNFSSKQLWTP